MASENRISFAELLSRRGDQPLPPGEALIYLKSIVASVERLHQRDTNGVLTLVGS